MYGYKFIASVTNLRTGDMQVSGRGHRWWERQTLSSKGELTSPVTWRSREVSGGLCGGTFVDVNFVEFLRRKFDGCLREFLEEFSDHEPKFSQQQTHHLSVTSFLEISWSLCIRTTLPYLTNRSLTFLHLIYTIHVATQDSLCLALAQEFHRLWRRVVPMHTVLVRMIRMLMYTHPPS